MRRFYIQVIETNRKKNFAYVARTNLFSKHMDEATLRDYWFNTEEDSDWIEKIYGRRFEDGRHPYIEKTIFEEG